MQTTCKTNQSGYEHTLTIGQEYEVLDICEGIFPGDHYITVDLGDDKKASALRHRFDLTKEQCDKFIQESEK